jgi:hypothetical protein
LSRAPANRPHVVTIAGGAVSILLLLLTAPVDATASPWAYPVVPSGEEAKFVTNLSAPPTEPGAGTSIQGAVGDPLNATISVIVLAIEFYSFVPYPGGSTQPLPTPSPSLATGAGSGPNATLTWPSLAAGGAVPFSVHVAVPSGTSQGAFLLRISLQFVSGGAAYLLESRGFFSPSLWMNATASNGTVNASRLGVSGVVPETAVSVEGPAAATYLYPLLGVALVLAAAGSYYAFRALPQSRSGTRGAGPEKKAETAFGKRRSNEGD